MVQNHQHAVTLHYMHHNFGRIHQTLLVTPAMEAGFMEHFDLSKKSVAWRIEITAWQLEPAMRLKHYEDAHYA